MDPRKESVPRWLILSFETIKISSIGYLIKSKCKSCNASFPDILDSNHHAYDSLMTAIWMCNNSAASYFKHEVYRHILKHKEQKYTHSDRMQIYHKADENFYIILRNPFNGAAFSIRWDNIRETYPQFLFIDCDIERTDKYHSYVYNELTPTNCIGPRMQDVCDDSDFFSEYVGEIMGWNYTCLYCGEEYESGLPSVEMVHEHLKVCVKL